MVTVTIEGGNAHFEVEGIDRFWSLRSRLTIPLGDIVNVTTDAASHFHLLDGIKLMGSWIPGILTAGTFWQRKEDGLVFWDVHDPARAIVVALAHQKYKKLVVEVEDPQGTALRLRQAAAAAAAGGAE